MACDQAHKQTNKLIKSKSGLADVLNNEDTRFLRKLENIIPEIHYYLEQVEDKTTNQKHKETSSKFVHSFINDIRLVRGRFSSNPFLIVEAKKVNSTVNNGYANLRC